MSDNNLTNSNSAAFSFNNNSTNAFNSIHNDSFNNIYISTTNANSLNDKTKQLEKLLGSFHDKPAINVFTETCLQLPLSINYLGRKWCHGLTTAADRNGGVILCYHPAFGDAVILNISDKKLGNRLLPVKFSPPLKLVFVVVAVYIPASLQDREKGIYFKKYFWKLIC